MPSHWLDITLFVIARRILVLSRCSHGPQKDFSGGNLSAKALADVRWGTLNR